MANMGKRGLEVQPYCLLCKYKLETTLHSLFLCRRARSIWQKIFPSLSLLNQLHLSFLELWNDLLSTISSTEREVIALTCWAIWNDRNQLIQGQQVRISSTNATRSALMPYNFGLLFHLFDPPWLQLYRHQHLL